jgi:hypothetical protein
MSATARQPADPSAPINPQRRGGTVVFEIPFSSPLGAAERESLRHQLGLTGHADHKLPVDPYSPASVRLDRFSGLFLERADGEDRWILQARTWGTPSAATVHGWRVRAAEVAHQFDHAVPVPERLPVAQPAPTRAGGNSGGRLAAMRRRLARLRGR